MPSNNTTVVQTNQQFIKSKLEFTVFLLILGIVAIQFSILIFKFETKNKIAPYTISINLTTVNFWQLESQKLKF